MPTSLPDSLRRILAIRLDNIGDVVMLSPALRALRQVYPSARITLMASPAGSQVTPLLPWVDDGITWQAVWQDIAQHVQVEPDKEYQLVEMLKERAFDAAFIFTSFSQSPYPPAYACYLAGIPIRVGQSREFGGGLLSHWVKPPEDAGYQVDRNLHLLTAAGLPVWGNMPLSNRMELVVPAADQRSADAVLAAAGISISQAYLALAPGASAATRRYSEERFTQVVQKLTSRTGLPIVLIGSPREMGRFPRLESLQNRVINLIGKTSVPEMAAIIQRSALLIGNNSGSMHIAAALKRPMVITFSGTELMEQWVPPTAAGFILNRPTFCAPCHAFQCAYHLECLDISADEVASTALRQLKLDLSPPPASIPSIEESIRR